MSVTELIARNREALEARLAQLKRAAELIDQPVASDAARPPLPNLELHHPWSKHSGVDIKSAGVSTEPVQYAAVICWSDLNRFRPPDGQYTAVTDLGSLRRPLSYAADLTIVAEMVGNPQSLPLSAETFEPKMELVLDVRYLWIVKATEYRPANLDAGAGLQFETGRIAYEAVLVDLESEQVLATLQGEATNSDQIESHYTYKADDPGSERDRVARTAAQNKLRDDLHERAAADFETRVNALPTTPQ